MDLVARTQFPNQRRPMRGKQRPSNNKEGCPSTPNKANSFRKKVSTVTRFAATWANKPNRQIPHLFGGSNLQPKPAKGPYPSQFESREARFWRKGRKVLSMWYSVIPFGWCVYRETHTHYKGEGKPAMRYVWCLCHNWRYHNWRYQKNESNYFISSSHLPFEWCTYQINTYS